MYTRDQIKNIRHTVSDSHNKKTKILLDVMQDLREVMDRMPDDLEYTIETYIRVLWVHLYPEAKGCSITVLEKWSSKRNRKEGLKE